MKLSNRVELRILALIAVFALLAAACTSGDDDDVTTTAAGTGTTAAVTTTAAPSGGGTDTTTATTAAPAVEGFVYTMGMTSDMTSDNFWAVNSNPTVYDMYVLENTKPGLYAIAFPGIVASPQLADGLPVGPVQEGDVWTVTQPLRTDFQWSDGSSITAKDVAFTYEAVKNTQLGGGWVSDYLYSEASSPRLLSVEAVDDFNVKYTFDVEPGSAIWPHTVGYAAIMPEAVWSTVVDSAVNTEDPAAVLMGADPIEVGDLSGGAVIYAGREEGAFIENVANTNYSNAGREHQWTSDGSYIVNGQRLYGEGGGDIEVEYTEGPYLERTAFSLYGDQAAAMLALTEGEIDYWVNPLGVSPGLRNQGLEAENLDVAVNPVSGFRFLAFNLRKSPGKFTEFRQAVATMINKEFLTQSVLQGVAFPLYTITPEGIQSWFDDEIAEEIASQYVGKSEEERINAAVALLKEGGWTWAGNEPTFDQDLGEIVPGNGLTDPEGNRLPQIEILAPPASYDPLRATAALWVEGWMEQLGVEAKANPTDFNTIVAKVWPGVGEEITFDTFILGYSLTRPVWPTFHEGFFHSRNWAEVNDGNNAWGYADDDFDALADSMFLEQDAAAAYDTVWEMEKKIAEDLPMIVLFDTPITEFFSNQLEFPFTSTLSGIQFQNGFQDSVLK